MDHQKKNWVETFAQAGYVAKGVVYFLVGALTAKAAIGMGGKKASNSDVMQEVMHWPGGKFMLGLLAVGLLGYSLWRFIQAAKDTEHKGNGAKGIGKRLAYCFSGLLYGSLAFLAFKIGTGENTSSGGDGEKEKFILTELLHKPFGKYLAIIIGLITIGNGIFQLKKAITSSFMKEVKGLPQHSFKVLKRAGQAGFAARGIVFSIIGFLFTKAAWHQKPNEASGTEGAFTFLQETPFGNILLAVVAIGLMGYGIFMFVQAKYSDISLD